jgi:hypothetical protein
VFENSMLRRIFGPKKNEVTGDWRKLHNEELRNLYSSLSITTKTSQMRWAGYVTRIGKKRNGRRILLRKSEGKTLLLKRPRHTRRWEDNIKIDLREIGWDGMDWIDLAQNRDRWVALVNMVINLQVPSILGNS